MHISILQCKRDVSATRTPQCKRDVSAFLPFSRRAVFLKSDVFLAWTRHVRARKTYLYMLIHFPCIDTEQMIFYEKLCQDYLVGWSYTTRDVDYTHISGRYTHKERSNIISPLYVFLAWTPSNTSFLHGRHADTSLLHGRPSDTSLLHGRLQCPCKRDVSSRTYIFTHNTKTTCPIDMIFLHNVHMSTCYVMYAITHFCRKRRYVPLALRGPYRRYVPLALKDRTSIIQCLASWGAWHCYHDVLKTS